MSPERRTSGQIYKFPMPYDCVCLCVCVLCRWNCARIYLLLALTRQAKKCGKNHEKKDTKNDIKIVAGQQAMTAVIAVLIYVCVSVCVWRLLKKEWEERQRNENKAKYSKNAVAKADIKVRFIFISFGCQCAGNWEIRKYYTRLLACYRAPKCQHSHTHTNTHTHILRRFCFLSTFPRAYTWYYLILFTRCFMPPLIPMLRPGQMLVIVCTKLCYQMVWNGMSIHFNDKFN